MKKYNFYALKKEAPRFCIPPKNLPLLPKTNTPLSVFTFYFLFHQFHISLREIESLLREIYTSSTTVLNHTLFHFLKPSLNPKYISGFQLFDSRISASLKVMSPCPGISISILCFSKIVSTFLKVSS